MLFDTLEEGQMEKDQTGEAIEEALELIRHIARHQTRCITEPIKTAEQSAEMPQSPFSGVYYDKEGRLYCEKCEIPLQFGGETRYSFGSETTWYCRGHLEHFYITSFATCRIVCKADHPVPNTGTHPDGAVVAGIP